MRTSQRRNHLVQLDLYQPQPTRPRWTTLPREVQQRVLPMLVRLLKEHRAGQPPCESRREVTDE